MPLYQFLLPAHSPSAARKAELARAVTDVHTSITGAPARYVNVVFVDVAAGSVYVAAGSVYVDGRPAGQGRLVGIVRTGRTPEVNDALIRGLADAWGDVTGEAADGFAVFLVETPGALMLEYGQTLPETAGP